MSVSSPIISFPKVNPIRFYKDTLEKPQFLTIPYFLQKKKYQQAYSRFDQLTFQVKIEHDGAWDYLHTLTLEAYDINDDLTYTFPAFTVIGDSFSVPVNDQAYYQMDRVLLSLPAGAYQLKLTVLIYNNGTPPPVLLTTSVFWSEPIELRDQWDNTVLFKYTHENNNMGAMFVDVDTTDVYFFYHRVHGGIWGMTPASKDVVYTDQEYDVTLLDSVPFETEKL